MSRRRAARRCRPRIPLLAHRRARWSALIFALFWAVRRPSPGLVSRSAETEDQLVVNRGRPRQAAQDRAAHLALFRDLRDAGAQLPAAGQFPGKPARSSRTARRRPISASICCPSSPRAISAGSASSRRSVERIEADALDHRAHGAVSRPSLQLVRHQDAAAAGPALCLGGRQRQSRRPSDRRRLGLQRMGRSAVGVICRAIRRHLDVGRHPGRDAARCRTTAARCVRCASG
jgi:hypothetical protein